MTEFTTIKGDLQIQAGFSAPAFDLLKTNTPLAANIYKTLQKYELRLSDMRTIRSGESFDSTWLDLTLFNYQSTLRVGLERIEANAYNIVQTPMQQTLDAFRDLNKAIHETIPSYTFKTLSLAVALHGTSPDKKIKDLPLQYIKNPPQMGFGPLATAGATFTFGATQDQLSASVTIENSYTLPDALFLRFYVAWDPSRTPIDTLKTSVDSFIRNTAKGLDLEIHGI